MSKQNFIYKLPITIIKQNKSFVAYCPILDISTVGKTVKDAQKKFAELSSLFFDELIEKGNLNDALEELGWKKKQKVWCPPEIVSNLSIGIKLPITI